MDDNSVRFRKSLIKRLSCSFSYLIHRFFCYYVALLGYWGSSHRLITCHHNNFNPCWSALENRKRNTVSWGIWKWEDTNKALFFELKVDIFIIELKTKGIFILWKVVFSKSKNPLSIVSKSEVGFTEPSFPIWVELNRLAMFIDMGT